MASLARNCSCKGTYLGTLTHSCLTSLKIPITLGKYIQLYLPVEADMELKESSLGSNRWREKQYASIQPPLANNIDAMTMTTRFNNEESFYSLWESCCAGTRATALSMQRRSSLPAMEIVRCFAVQRLVMPVPHNVRCPRKTLPLSFCLGSMLSLPTLVDDLIP